ncbi:MAG: hypothetical protein IJZ82_03715 [Lachnospiraceae bacterium]|nr:hypothetical protein [Lachnospiraceae bacterium]
MWLEELFKTVLQMSITGSIVILFVLVARVVLCKVPKIYSYLLWMFVFFRLLCPVSFTSEWSLIPNEAIMIQNVTQVIQRESTGGTETSGIGVLSQSEDWEEQLSQEEDKIIESLVEENIEIVRKPEGSDWMWSSLWALGVGILIIYTIATTRKLKKEIKCAVCLKENIYVCDYIETPFIMGVFTPKIYLPSDLSGTETEYIIAHEKHHIRRWDHVIKLFAYSALCLHWFNPLVWLTYILAGKDMEMSCDEAVLDGATENIRQAYSMSLLRLSTGHRNASFVPLAFGEGKVKGRIKNIMNYNRPSFWIVILCTVACIGLGTALCANPKAENTFVPDATNSSEEKWMTPEETETFTEEVMLQYVTVWEKNVDYNGDGTEDTISFVIQIDAAYEEYQGVTDGYELLRAPFIGIVQCVDGATGELNFATGNIAHARLANRQISYAEKDGSHYMISTQIHEQMGDGYYVYEVYSLTEQELVDSYEIYFVTSGDDFHARPTAKYRQEVVPEFKQRLEKWTDDAVLIVATDVNERAENGIFVSSTTQSYAACYYYDLVWERMLDEKVRVDSLGPKVNLPQNDEWIQNPQYLLSDYPIAHIKYYDGLADASLMLRYGEADPIELSYLYDITFDEEQERSYTTLSQDEDVVIKCQVSSRASSGEEKTVLVSWSYQEFNYVIFGELKKDADMESLIQTAIYVIENYE